MRDFEKINFSQFKADVKDDKLLYDSYLLPQRDSVASAGYDIYLLEDLHIKPNEIKSLPTGLKAYFPKDEMLMLVLRSFAGFKYNIRLCNQVGIVDADAYHNRNDGHIWIKIQNEGDKEVFIPKGEAIVQGIFLKYLTTRSDRRIDIERRGRSKNDI